MGRLALVLLAGVWLSACQPQGDYQPLWVQVANQSSQRLARVEIQHGNANTQEQITLLQLESGQSRMLALNHQPGQGFSLTVVYADGTSFEMCVGKYIDAPVITEVITDDGLDERAGR